VEKPENFMVQMFFGLLDDLPKSDRGQVSKKPEVNRVSFKSIVRGYISYLVDMPVVYCC